MTKFRVASRILKETVDEKCPKCLESWSDFMVINDH
ncbi:unnamed protein product, partial [marine sediment metagenome]